MIYRREWVLVREAIKTGRLKRPEACQSCGEIKGGKSLHAHHEDYSKPLEVVWLCDSCHYRLHTSRGRAPRANAIGQSQLRLSKYLKSRRETA